MCENSLYVQWVLEFQTQTFEGLTQVALMFSCVGSILVIIMKPMVFMARLFWRDLAMKTSGSMIMVEAFTSLMTLKELDYEMAEEPVMKWSLCET